jgi:tRNA nucleotidyltransferase (CCA-adding enzyme)
MLFTWIPSNRRDESRRRCATPAAARSRSADSYAIDLLGRASKDLRHRGLRHSAGSPRAASEVARQGRAAGQAFPVYKLGDIDVALPRRESKTGRGHKGFTVEGDPTMSFDEAARRRDFTINAIGWDPLTDEYLDPFHGAMICRTRFFASSIPTRLPTIHCVSLRAVQFAARFDLTIGPETARICSSIALDDLPASASGASSRSCCCRRSGRQSASRSHASSA